MLIVWLEAGPHRDLRKGLAKINGAVRKVIQCILMHDFELHNDHTSTEAKNMLTEIMAEALGGRAVKYDGGWGIGRDVYETNNMPSWATPAPPEIAIHAIHLREIVGGAKAAPSRLAGAEASAPWTV